jgi:hypothetical protein
MHLVLATGEGRDDDLFLTQCSSPVVAMTPTGSKQSRSAGREAIDAQIATGPSAFS